ncbi:hypothetical protein HLV38_02975 [Berryella wangjianweii]|uniref:Uncharacterized protein n=1 Tax=Berryella wangjianweii TaxID=2734634 RepID=A0A6M8IZP2_9ACTN|nr:hypothetical protein [Berryella wangjianweii]QKF07200.1 hypothetical protein HLV38_02975 [Berryella wangjianweii]
MRYDVDHDYEFETDDFGFPLLPEGLRRDERGLLVLPNGRYLPGDSYKTEDESYLIYEPLELTPYAEMLAQIHDEEA